MMNVDEILQSMDFYDGVLHAMQEANGKVQLISAASFEEIAEDDTIIDFTFNYAVNDIQTIYTVKKDDEIWKIKNIENIFMHDRGLVRYDKERNNFTVLDNTHVSGDAPIDVNKSTLIEILEGDDSQRNEIEKAVEKKLMDLSSYQEIDGFEFNFEDFENFDDACITSNVSFNI